MTFLFRRIDWKLCAALGMLLAAGLLSLLSTSPDIFGKQVAWVLLGIFVALLLVAVDLRSFFSHPNVIFGIYALVLITLLATYLFAPVIKGNRAWLSLAGFQFQPSEFAKIALILVLAYFFSKKHVGIARWKTLIISFIYCALPAGLIALQPDLGSSLVLFAIWLGFIIASGVPLRRLAVTAGIFALALLVLWNVGLQEYQKARIVGVFNPELDPRGVSYSVIQSKIAIGSGGVFGKGFGQGTQVQLGFLPEAHNDFIFAAIAEEGGLVGVMALVGAFSWMLFRLLHLGLLMERNFYKFLTLGAVILFLAQFIFHVGSNIGLLPVIGTTLPFVSYGGSSILANMIVIGIIQSAYSRR